jgi:hypothetical protein
VAFASDSFNRSGFHSLGSTDGVGSNDPFAWTLRLGNQQVVSGSPLSCSGPAVGVHICTIDVGVGDGDLICTVATPAIGAVTVGVVFRYSDNSNYLYAAQKASGAILLVKRVAAVETTLGTAANTNATIDLRVVFYGSTVNVYRNNVLAVSASDSFNATATKIGCYGDDTTAVSPTGFNWASFEFLL